MHSARYHSLRDRVVAQVDRVFAEPVRLSFMKDGQLDPDRPIIEIEAVLRTDKSVTASPSGGRDRGWQSRVSSQPAQLHIDRSRYPDIVVRGLDKVRALSRPGMPWFEVLSVEDRGMNRLVLNLGEA